MKYIILIVSLICLTIMFLNIDNKIFGWVGVPFFLTFTIVNIVKYIRKSNNKS
jgi:hypothetical protein